MSEYFAHKGIRKFAGERVFLVVPPAGFEPAAFCSGGRRSIP
jgi:hypothetical protein